MNPALLQPVRKDVREHENVGTVQWKLHPVALYELVQEGEGLVRSITCGGLALVPGPIPINTVVSSGVQHSTLCVSVRLFEDPTSAKQQPGHCQ